MADPSPNIPGETIATNRPSRKIVPPARLTDGNNSAVPVLSSHRVGIAAHAAAKAAYSIPAQTSHVAHSTPLPAALPQSSSAVVGPTPFSGLSTPRPSTSHDDESGKSPSRRATVEEDDEDEITPPPSKRSHRGMKYLLTMDYYIAQSPQ